MVAVFVGLTMSTCVLKRPPTSRYLSASPSVAKEKVVDEWCCSCYFFQRLLSSLVVKPGFMEVIFICGAVAILIRRKLGDDGGLGVVSFFGLVFCKSRRSRSNPNEPNMTMAIKEENGAKRQLIKWQESESTALLQQSLLFVSNLSNNESDKFHGASTESCHTRSHEHSELTTMSLKMHFDYNDCLNRLHSDILDVLGERADDTGVNYATLFQRTLFHHSGCSVNNDGTYK